MNRQQYFGVSCNEEHADVNIVWGFPHPIDYRVDDGLVQ